jgi:hypothetical protein
VHGHDGLFRGFEAILTRYLEEDVTIIALANLAEVDLAEITESIAETHGSKVALRVQAPVELVINLETAKALGSRRAIASRAARRQGDRIAHCSPCTSFAAVHEPVLARLGSADHQSMSLLIGAERKTFAHGEFYAF